MYILGISCYFHDAAAAILRDGILVAAADEERFSRRKHDPSFPIRSIRFCLDQAGISDRELDYVVFYEKPLKKLGRVLSSGLRNFPWSTRVFSRSMSQWIFDRIWIKNRIAGLLQISPERIIFVEHHLSHAASAFLSSPFEESAILTADGVGEWATTTIGRGKASWDQGTANDMCLNHEIRFPHSLGLLYAAFTAFLGFRVNSDEYKVMGMSSFGQPTYLDALRQMVTVLDDGSFELDMTYFTYDRSTNSTFSSKFIELLGISPRPPNIDFELLQDNSKPNSRQLNKHQEYANIAASIQVLTEEILVKMARYALSQSGSLNLCMAGGVALNGVANMRVLQETQCEQLYIQPAAGDSGGALGAALYAYHILLGHPRNYVMDHVYYGKEYNQQDVNAALVKSGLQFEEIDNEDKLIDVTVDHLTNGDALGWFQGRFEWGPRALGNRSILADPRSSSMKDRINIKVKFREPFRPFAPAIIDEYIHNYFQIPGGESNYPAQFMLLVAPVNSQKRDEIPAVTHVDGSGRVQTVRRKTNPRYYDLIKKFGDATGVPVLLNTSFNLKGEPIVSSPDNAINTFQNSGLDVLVMGNHIATKQQHRKRYR